MMTKKLLWILGMVWMGIGGVGMSAAQTGRDVVVVNTLEDRESGCPETCSLREAVAIVAAGGMIRFETPAGVVMVSAPIRIDHDVIIEGNASTQAAGNAQTKIFIVQDADVYIRNVTIRQGYATDAGGAIENHGTLTLEAVHFYDNISTESGGAIYNTGALTVRHSRFERNAALNGGAITSANTNNTYISESIFLRNTAEGDGGALYGDFGGFVVLNSTFDSNLARHGGAILMDGFLDRGIVANSTIVRNRAEFGGGVCNLDEDSLFMLTSSIIAENEADRSPDVCPLMTSGGHNLIGVSAGGRWVVSDLLDRESGLLLEPDRFKPMIPLHSDSPAIGMGDCGGNALLFIEPVTTDQRGAPRKTPCDIGAYETELPTN